MDGEPQPGQRPADRRDLLAAVDLLVAVAVAVDRDQHRGCDLAPPVDHAAGAELRRARREDRADARRGQQQHQGLGDVRQVRRDPVAALDTEPDQPRPGPRHLVAQLGCGQLDRVAALRAADDHDVVVGPARQREHGLGVVELHPREPARARHRRLGQRRVEAALVGNARRTRPPCARTRPARRPTTATARRSRRRCVRSSPRRGACTRPAGSRSRASAGGDHSRSPGWTALTPDPATGRPPWHPALPHPPRGRSPGRNRRPGGIRGA